MDPDQDHCSRYCSTGFSIFLYILSKNDIKNINVQNVKNTLWNWMDPDYCSRYCNMGLHIFLFILNCWKGGLLYVMELDGSRSLFKVFSITAAQNESPLLCSKYKGCLSTPPSHPHHTCPTDRHMRQCSTYLL